MGQRIDTVDGLEFDGKRFVSDGKCPVCGVDITEDGDGLRMRIVNDGHAWIEKSGAVFDLGYSYDTDTPREEYSCYSCETVLITIRKD